MNVADLLDITLNSEGVRITYQDSDLPEGVLSQRTFFLPAEELGVTRVERMLEVMEEVNQWLKEMLTPPPEHGPYENPEEVARWGEGA